MSRPCVKSAWPTSHLNSDSLSSESDCEGKTGRHGRHGHRGKRGKRGPRGPHGPHGKHGDQGDQGASGFVGSTGFVGSSGFVGSTGIRGSRFLCTAQLYTGIAVNINNVSPGTFVGQLKLDLTNGNVYQWNGANWVQVILPLPFDFLANDIGHAGVIYHVVAYGAPVQSLQQFSGLLPGDILLDEATGQLYELQANGTFKQG